MNMQVEVGGIKFKNPILTASGCFGFGREYAQFYDLSKLGGIAVKSISLEQRLGNPVPRVCETSSGMLNAIGLQNKGLDYIKKHELPFLKQFDTGVLANIAGSTEYEYIKVIEGLNDEDVIDAFELNISCPNVKCGGMSFGTDPELAYDLTKKCKEVAKKPLFVKLSPNVTDIVSIARAVVDAGADALVLINTLVGMRMNLKTGKPILANKTGGLSGPAIMPVAIANVYKVATAMDVDIIGVGGISSAEDALEFFNAGAKAVQIGAANFVDPYASLKIVNNLENVLRKYNYKSLDEAIGRSFR